MGFNGRGQFHMFEAYGWACSRSRGRHMDEQFSRCLVISQYDPKQVKKSISAYMKSPTTSKLLPVSYVQKSLQGCSKNVGIHDVWEAEHLTYRHDTIECRVIKGIHRRHDVSIHSQC